MLLTSTMLMVLANPPLAEDSRLPAVTHSGVTAQAPHDRTSAQPPKPPDGVGAPVPEATTLLLVGSGLVGLAVSRRRRREPGE